MPTLYLDTETYSPVPITNGTHAYAESVEIIMWQYAIDDGEVIVENHLSDTLKNLIDDKSNLIVIHNSHFDRTVIRHGAGVDIPVSRIFDTMACALAHSLPGGLEALCDVLRVDKDKAKDKEGKKWINLFCKPNKVKNKEFIRIYKEDRPEEWELFTNYGKLDIIALREIYKKLPRWNYSGFEKNLWNLDQKINDRGMCIDLDLAHSAVRAATRAQEEYAAETKVKTEGEVSSTNQRNALLEYILKRHKVEIENLRSASIEKLIESNDLPAGILDLLSIRLEASKTSTSKYKTVIRAVSRDGRLRNSSQYCGASRSGRWAGRLFQPQNLPRPTIKNDALEIHIKELKCNSEGL